MVALQIRDVPEAVHRSLSEQASARGQSLQAFLLRLVTDQADRSDNLAMLDGFARRDDGSRLTADEATTALDLAREER